MPETKDSANEIMLDLVKEAGNKTINKLPAILFFTVVCIVGVFALMLSSINNNNAILYGAFTTLCLVITSLVYIISEFIKENTAVRLENNNLKNRVSTLEVELQSIKEELQKLKSKKRYA